MVTKEKQKADSKKIAIKLAVLTFMLVAVCAAPAAAEGYTFNGTLSDLGQVITDFLTLSDELIQLVIFGVIISCAGAIGGFITGFFGVIISNLHR